MPTATVLVTGASGFIAKHCIAELLRHAEKAAAARGADTLWLTAWASNARALQFYPRRGYEALGMTVYTISGEDYPNHLFCKRVRHVASA